MNIVYAESSAVLAWLIGEPGHPDVLETLSNADHVVASTLTLVECARALARARHMRRLKVTEELAALRLLDEVAASWHVLGISERVAARARGAFPHEPVRTLDALHLATAVVFAETLGSLRVLSLDDRVRNNAIALGLPVVPAASTT
ncbi:MAG: type II toxin-antitoxin system VapC family toxin [Gemmatimonadaceae bacterium]